MLLASLALTAIVYWPGLSGSWLFDDYPNIVDNHGVQPQHATLGTLITAALSSPSSEFKRPLASLSFAANYLATGLDPFWMKATNLLIHLLNGLVIFALARRLMRSARQSATSPSRTEWIAALIAAGWLLLPINLTGVLYVVQRMESLANLFVLLGLLGYVAGRERMVTGNARAGFTQCVASIALATGLGITTKETAVMLPLYAFLVEWVLYRFRGSDGKISRPLVIFYIVVLATPLAAGLGWLLPGLLRPSAWANRDFTLGTRLLSEARIVVDYIGWTLLPTPHALSFYHDDFRISTGVLSPWTTLTSILLLATLGTGVILLRRRRPLVALGLALYLGCHLLTGTILPLELIYEHRNYFASFGLLLALIPLLAARGTSAAIGLRQQPVDRIPETEQALPFRLPRRVLLVGLMMLWTIETALTAYAWGNPLRLAEDMAARAPRSPRAQYELGRTYIIYSHYDPQSPFTRMAYAPLERAMALPESSILPEQALIFMNSRMGLPIRDAWWDSLTAKLKAHTPGVQDESSLAALTQCARDGRCQLPTTRMMEAFLAALSHPNPSARLLATYADYAWNVLGDRPLGLRMAEAAAEAAPNEPAYRISETRMLIAEGQGAAAKSSLDKLSAMNIGGTLDKDLSTLRTSIARIAPAHSARTAN
ncbi:MAG: hypothetical protein B7X39_02155 [Lysobacterales bacterium 14-68-21]|jgi:hypothetical protein|nr:MAG: hypothetical protein B7X45_03785 [Xanthomonadales bacterium 15-68-25]OZB68000.1 MAG: hypothetical protein B7X39_02155 [Xanthomonadales bacterium 14-68-21]